VMPRRFCFHVRNANNAAAYLIAASAAVRALLRHGASVSARSTAPTLAISPSLQPPGSTALHFAAAAEDVSLVLVLLEAQVGPMWLC
jgi:ankyrin repeat protein